MTISATTAMTTISENPISNMEASCPRRARRGNAACGAQRRRREASGLRLRLLLDLGVDRAAGDLLRRGLRARGGVGLFLGALHAFLEAAHRAAQVLADV